MELIFCCVKERNDLMVNIIKQEISNLQNEVSNLEDNKEYINKQITNLNKDKKDIVDEIDKKRKDILGYKVCVENIGCTLVEIS